MSELRACKNPACEQINPQPLENFHKRGRHSLLRRHVCKKCWAIKTKFGMRKFYKNNSELCSQRVMESAKKNIPKRRERGRKFRNNNLERIREYDRMLYAKDPSKKKHSTKKYAKTHPHKINAYFMRRQVNKLNRTPAWLTEDDVRFMELFYKEASRLSKETGILYQVDHIVPIKGKNVSGLHVPWNLQILTKTENIKKGNKF